jgi:hypothetical protein
LVRSRLEAQKQEGLSNRLLGLFCFTEVLAIFRIFKIVASDFVIGMIYVPLFHLSANGAILSQPSILYEALHFSVS